MCNNFKTLAQHDDYRKVTRCEHGTVHLHWYRASLHMPQKDFFEVALFLEDALHDNLPKARSPKVFYRMDNQARYHLWMMGMGLYLSAAEFLMLVDMMRRAVSHISDFSVGQRRQKLGNYKQNGVLELLDNLNSLETMFSLN